MAGVLNSSACPFPFVQATLEKPRTICLETRRDLLFCLKIEHKIRPNTFMSFSASLHRLAKSSK